MERDGLQQHMARSTHRILGREEEHELAVRSSAGDREAFETLVTHNIRLVYSIARRYLKTGVPLDDLIQDGTLGLMHAIRKFDPSRGFKLSTYATWWIQQSIDRAVNQRGGLIRLPEHIATEVARVRRTKWALELEHGRDVTNDEIAEEADVDVERVEELLRITAPILSLEYEPEPDVTLAATLADNDVDVEGETLRSAETEALRQWIAEIPARERRVIELRFGLDGGAERTLEDVGRELGVTRERVRQIQNRGLEMLRVAARRAA